MLWGKEIILKCTHCVIYLLLHNKMTPKPSGQEQQPFIISHDSVDNPGFLLQVTYSTKSLIQPLQSARSSAGTEISKMVSFTYLEVGVGQQECYCAHGFSSASRLDWLSYSMTAGYKEGKTHFCTRTYQISFCIMFVNVPLAMQVTWPKPSLLCTYEETEVSCD